MSETRPRTQEPCEVHELANCGLCHPPPKGYARGSMTLDVPPGHFIEVRPGRGVYHHPDCATALGDWDGSDLATLGDRIVRSPAEIAELGLRPAQCCDPPTVRAADTGA